MIGFGRQTMSNILSNGEYFTQKQAILFSLAFGYNKEYLMTGKGPLLSTSSPERIREAFEYRDRLLNIFRQAQGLSATGIELISRHGVEECKPLINKLRRANDFVKTLDQYPPVYVNGYENPPYDLTLMDAAERIFMPIYKDLAEIIEKQYGVAIDIIP